VARCCGALKWLAQSLSVFSFAGKALHLLYSSWYHFGAQLSTSMATVTASALGALWLHSMCGLSLVAAFWIAHEFFAVNLISDADTTLLILWVCCTPLLPVY